jgi:hypothetical protein
LRYKRRSASILMLLAMSMPLDEVLADTDRCGINVLRGYLLIVLVRSWLRVSLETQRSVVPSICFLVSKFR